MTPAWPAIDPRQRMPAALGVVALVLASTLEWGVLPVWRSDLEAARSANSAEARPSDPVPATSWPTAAEAPARTGRLIAQARRHGVTVKRSRESWDAPAAALRVELQAEGRYSDLRLFLAFALAEDTALALESLRVQRRGSGGPELLQFDLQWRLLHQPAFPAI